MPQTLRNDTLSIIKSNISARIEFLVIVGGNYEIVFQSFANCEAFYRTLPLPPLPDEIRAQIV